MGPPVSNSGLCWVPCSMFLLGGEAAVELTLATVVG